MAAVSKRLKGQSLLKFSVDGVTMQDESIPKDS